MTDITYDRVQHYLGRLKLNRIAEQLDPLAEQAAKEEWTYLTFLEHILDAEVSARYARDVVMKTKLAHFPFPKTLDEFDFAFQSSINQRQLHELATVRFVANSENLLFLGPPGVGLQRLPERLVERSELVRLLPAPVLRRAIHLAVQPLRNRVARQPRHARDLALRFVLPGMQTPDPANHVHGDHSSSSAAQKNSRVG